MLRKVWRVLRWVLLLAVLYFAVQTARNWDTIRRVFLGGLHVHETAPPALPADLPRPAVLVFSKTNAFRHEEAIPAGNRFFADLARAQGWGHFQTENGAAFSPAILSRFDAVVFNNASGDILSPEQWQAFQAFVENGGGYVGLHAAGDHSIDQGWYIANLIGATFTMHTLSPQFQEATVRVEDKAHPATRDLPDSWKRTEEWYSFAKSPREKGFHVLATVDERTYKPVGPFGKDLRMGADHPAAWTHCAGKGRVFYTIFGHRAETFAEPEVVKMLTGAVGWAVRKQGEGCDPAAPAGEQAK